MFPSKITMEYMSEINRLFPRTEDEDPPSYTLSTYQSPYQLARINRSSSSTDSTSPESYPDISFNRSADYRPMEIPRALVDNTFTIKRQRAIVGRKILGSHTTQVSPADKIDELNFWQPNELPETPPGSINQAKNSFYELFPIDNKNEFKTPVKSESKTYIPDLSPRSSNFSVPRSPMSRLQNLSDMSPPNFSSQHCNMSRFIPQKAPSLTTSLLSPTWSSHSSIPQRYSSNSNAIPRYISKSSPSPGASSSKADEIASTKLCTFCKKNGETPIVYMTHCVKERVGNKNVVTCPILRSHVCATCGASGDDAHTITYCPVLRSTNNGKPLQSTTITLKNTRIKSNGRRRY